MSWAGLWPLLWGFGFPPTRPSNPPPSTGSATSQRHGFKFYGKTFRFAYFKPAHGANYEVLELFGKNRLTVTRQVPCHPGDLPAPSGARQAGNRTLDMVLAVNGLPVSTIELKNPGTGQSWRNAVRRQADA